MMKRKIVSLFFIIMMITGLFVLTGCVSKESNYLKENADRIVSGSIEKDRNTNFDTLYEHDFTENEIKEIITQFKNCKLKTKKITEKNWEKIEEKLNENGKQISVILTEPLLWNLYLMRILKRFTYAHQKIMYLFLHGM